ncbi:hypothetical protein EG68_11604 [Paragonimus skrjabini miyazakii]|uniref:DUF4806 domain-containing protein n=1 Tax=Paragonimus skrjabini miyazakii TaxID=59628 RepID=A0A8S9YJ72_9TREM|nr:hypothetical protein EG68_11604 [Paragonimus skrjabini miyazakii]
MERMMMEITRLSNKHKPYLPLPVTSVMQLHEIDRKMLDAKFHPAMADYFQGIGALSVGALLRNMMQRLMTGVVAGQTTYSGAHQTFGFKQTQLKAFLLGQIHERTEYDTTPDSTLNEYFKGWLHCARDKRSTQHASASRIEDENMDSGFG